MMIKLVSLLAASSLLLILTPSTSEASKIRGVGDILRDKDLRYCDPTTGDECGTCLTASFAEAGEGVGWFDSSFGLCWGEKKDKALVSLWVDLRDVLKEDNRHVLPANCTLDKMTYHLHSKWEHPEGKNWGLGAECGPALTSGHYDPTFACGPSSEHVASGACKEKGKDPAQYKCLGDYQEYRKDPQICELGDTSGKGGYLQFPGKKRVVEETFVDVTPPSYYEFRNGKYKSLVFHCAGGQRAFCAKLKLKECGGGPDKEKTF